MSVLRSGCLALALACVPLTAGCSALGLFDLAPAVSCVVDDDCRVPGLIEDPCVRFTCEPHLRLCVGALVDVDGDGQGPLGCAASAYAEMNATDCNDADPTVALDALELCGGADNDCDGTIDEACVVPQIALGVEHACYLARPLLLCWGSNSSGQIGVGDAAPVGAHPRQVRSIEDPVSIAVGSDATCATTGDGRVFCWGANDHGQLGLAPPARRLVPTEIPALAGVSSLGLGERFGCAIQNHTVVCWGSNHLAIFADPAAPSMSETPRAISGIVDPVEVRVGQTSACARTMDGSVWCWGDGAPARAISTCSVTTSPCHIPLAAAATAVEVGRSHACAISHDVVVCWGFNAHGELGDVTDADGIAHPRLPAPTSVAAGGDHTCAVAAGDIWCWGSNSQSQLGFDLRVNVPEPAGVLPMLTHIAQVRAGDGGTCALTETGNALCWGGNGAGQLGATTDTAFVSTPVGPLATWGADGRP